MIKHNNRAQLPLRYGKEEERTVDGEERHLQPPAPSFNFASSNLTLADS